MADELYGRLEKLTIAQLKVVAKDVNALPVGKKRKSDYINAIKRERRYAGLLGSKDAVLSGISDPWVGVRDVTREKSHKSSQAGIKKFEDQLAKSVSTQERVNNKVVRRADSSQKKLVSFVQSSANNNLPGRPVSAPGQSVTVTKAERVLRQAGIVDVDAAMHAKGARKSKIAGHMRYIDVAVTHDPLAKRSVFSKIAKVAGKVFQKIVAPIAVGASAYGGYQYYKDRKSKGDGTGKAAVKGAAMAVDDLVLFGAGAGLQQLYEKGKPIYQANEARRVNSRKAKADLDNSRSDAKYDYALRMKKKYGVKLPDWAAKRQVSKTRRFAHAGKATTSRLKTEKGFSVLASAYDKPKSSRSQPSGATPSKTQKVGKAPKRAGRFITEQVRSASGKTFTRRRRNPNYGKSKKG